MSQCFDRDSLSFAVQFLLRSLRNLQGLYNGPDELEDRYQYMRNRVVECLQHSIMYKVTSDGRQPILQIYHRKRTKQAGNPYYRRYLTQNKELEEYMACNTRKLTVDRKLNGY
jgi:hypothetical protein